MTAKRFCCDGTNLHWRTKNLTGQRFSRLLVESPSSERREGNRAQRWNAVCDCGTRVVVLGSSLRSGETTSCGCFQREIARRAGDRTRTHGLSRSSLYNIWTSMLQRCQNKKRKDFENYGGRGIRVCERWQTFENFKSDMGVRPRGMTLNRIDNDGNYGPGNCEWSTIQEQARNTRSTKTLELHGEALCAVEWAERLGMPYSTLTARLRRNWSVTDALTKPVDRRFSRV